MNVTDFEYDGIKLSDMGYIVCNFDNKGNRVFENGSVLNFNTLSSQNGYKFDLVSSNYSECLGAVLQICKNPCSNKDNYNITKKDIIQISEWLNRREFHKLRFVSDDYINVHTEASFNISCIEHAGNVVGFELNIVTNRPHLLLQSERIVLNNTITNGKKYIIDSGNAEGYIYPKMKITLKQSGNLSIFNELDNQEMIIKNCTNGEIIEIDYPIISTSVSGHKIQDDFNWNFFRIVNTFRDKTNKITISLPCVIEIEYSPILKSGI